MDLGIKDKIAIVTGSSRGLGFATANALAGEGARVVICSRNKPAIEQAAHEIHKNTGGTVIPVVADISVPGDIRNVADVAVNNFGTIHILVNNTGGPPVADFEDITDDTWTNGFDLVLMSMIRFIRSILPYMKNQKWGRIVTISSIAAKQPIDDLIISSTLRPGIHALNRILTNKYASNNILFNAVAPGFILTGRLREIFHSRAEKDSSSFDEQIRHVAKNIPIERMGDPKELASAIAFLVSDKASYIGGTTLSVDGGLLKGVY
jgi:3-oxoacyl-[acyl-carrier protein] reductase